MWVQQCHKPSIFDGWNPTHKNGDELGMVHDIAIPTLYVWSYEYVQSVCLGIYIYTYIYV